MSTTIQNQKHMNPKIVFVLRVIVAIILIQTLRFKFTAAPESVYIFSELGMEPYGRIGIGVLELIAGILLFIPRTVWMGAVLSLGLMGGAIIAHITVLGINTNGDGGILFATAVLVFALSALILKEEKHRITFSSALKV